MVRPMGGVCDWLGGGGGGERRLPRCLTPCASRAKSLKSEIDVTFVGGAVTRAFAAVRTSRGIARGGVMGGVGDRSGGGGEGERRLTLTASPPRTARQQIFEIGN